MRSVTHAPDAETRATARVDIDRNGSSPVCAFTRTIRATGRARRPVPSTRHSARGPRDENDGVITLQ